MNHSGTNSSNQIMHQNPLEALTKTLASSDIGYIGEKSPQLSTNQSFQPTQTKAKKFVFAYNLTLIFFSFVLYQKKQGKKKFKK